MRLEIGRIPDPERRSRATLALMDASRTVPVAVAEIERARRLESLGFTPLDALHLACAESGGASIFLTTDDKLLRLALRVSSELRLRVENPLAWGKETLP